jgi:high-affinity nickel-transport protein
LLGTCLLAYSFGLRHAVDADHIAAIDNVTRKLLQEGKRPLTTGLYFSLGHSTIVILLSAVVALTAAGIKTEFSTLALFGNTAGTLISACFLFALAIMNFTLLLPMLRLRRRMRAGGTYTPAEIDPLLVNRGCFSRIFRGLFALIRHDWQMYPIGLLFGLGFDTATEIGVLGISAAEATNGLHIWSIMLFPALFTAGMSLIDTADGILMLNAYGWAFLNPLRKLTYNLAITAVSVTVALGVGSIELLGLFQTNTTPGLFWNAIAAINAHFTLLGYAIISLFAVAWAGSWLLNRIKYTGANRVTVTEQ